MKYKLLLLIVILVNATGLFSGVMEPDGALYAYIAKQMAQHNDFINLYNSTDWLDKPHFPFWIIAISFKILGISSFAYKLPAFLFWLMGIGYLYKLGKELYNRQTAIIAVFIYTTALQAVIGLLDVRAEHYLTALMIAAIYYLYKLYTSGKGRYILLAALFSACAVMTKGIFFLITITSGFAVMIIIKKDWKQLANYRWYLYLFLTLLFITPELYCLYTQFDMHPEKVVYGKTGVSGLRFFFWDSQFGRFFNTGPIKGKGDLFFFFHTLLWTFLPWSILFYTAVVRLLKEKKVIYNSAQWIVIGSAAITFIIFSLSQFQLPHYLIVIFPQFALLCADYLVNKQSEKSIRAFVVMQRILLVSALLLVEAATVIFNLPFYGWIIIVAAFIAATCFYLSQSNDLSSVIRLGIGFFVIVHLFLNICFYPVLLQYQSGSVAAKWLNNEIKTPSLGLFKAEDFSLKWYADSKVIPTDTIPFRQKNGVPVEYFFTSQKNADSLSKAGVPIQKIKTFSNFHISKITLPFFYKNSRASQLDTTVIIKFRR